MEYLDKYYTKDYIEGVSSDLNFAELVQLIKEISTKNGVKFEIFENGEIKLSGSADLLGNIHDRINNLNNGTNQSDDVSSSVDRDMNEIKVNADKRDDGNDGQDDLSGRQHVSIVDHLALNFISSDHDKLAEDPEHTHSREKSSSNFNDTNSEGDEVVSDSIGAFEKLEVGGLDLLEEGNHSTTGALTTDIEGEVSAPFFHVVPSDAVVIDVPVKDMPAIPQNVNPLAGNDVVAVNQDTLSANIHSLLLSNDTDDEILDILSVNNAGLLGQITFNAGSDTLTYNTGNVFDYLASGETTTDIFTYIVTDGLGGQDTASVTVTVTGVNDGPGALDDAFLTDEDTGATGNVLVDNGSGSDFDVDVSDTFSVTAVAGDIVNLAVGTVGSNGGTFTILANGSLSFSVGSDFQDLGLGETRDTTISYTITDNNGGTDTATVTMTVSGINDMPNAVDDGVYSETDENGNSIIISEADLMANDTDPESDPLEITSMSIGSGEGGLIDNGDGTWTYTPPANSLSFSGMTTITYTLEDDSGLSDTATFQLRVFNVINGTNGNDTLTYENNNTSHKFIALDGDDTIIGSDQRDILIGGNGNDVLIGNDGDDDFIFEGNLTGIDSVDGGSGVDRILGGTGDDTFSLSSFTSIRTIDMGAGTDTLLGTAGNDAFNFSGITITDLDVINGNGGTDTIVGTSSSDTIDLSNVTSLIGIDYIDGGDGNDVIHGSQSNDQIIIRDGTDQLYGEGGDDIFQLTTGQTGRKYIHGDGGYDQLLGTASDDFVRLASITNIEHIDFGTGTNTLYVNYDATVDFSSFAAADFLNVTYIADDNHREMITGSQGDDVFHINADGYNDVFNG
ncbi:MAG: hypothetical protein COA45_12340, partial [Zetaproteobacteria bacterium]